MTEHYCPPVLVYKQKWNKRQFKWRFPNTDTCHGSTRWFLKVDLIEADNLVRTQSTFLKWYKINGGKTLMLIWNWTHRLYESWHLRMRKLHMGDQSFSDMIYFHIYRFDDFMFASRHTSLIHTGHIPQGPSWKHALQTPGLNLQLLHGLGSRVWWGKPHICFMTVSIRVSMQIRATLMVAQGLKVQVQHPPAVFLLQGNSNTLWLLPAEVYIHWTLANYFELMWASQCQWRYLSNQTLAARNYSWFPYPGDN